MLEQAIKDQLAGYLQRLEAPIDIVASLDDSDKSEKIKQ